MPAKNPFRSKHNNNNKISQRDSSHLARHQNQQQQRDLTMNQPNIQRSDLYFSRTISFPFTLSYWPLIEQALSDPIQNSSQLNQVLINIQKAVCEAVGMTPFTPIQSQTSLTLLLEGKIFGEEWKQRDQFFETTLPFMMDLVKQSPNILGPDAYQQLYGQVHSTIISNEGLLPVMGTLNRIPVLARPKSKVMTFNKLECACILANAFFLTWPRLADTREASVQMPSINFDTLFKDSRPSSIAKLLMIIHYFERISARNYNEIASHGSMTVIRKCVDARRVKDQIRLDSFMPLSDISVHTEGSLEQCENALHADFANCYIGGGVLRGGAVQEEIRFCLSPEAIVTRLFVEKLDDNEVLYILGTEQFSEHDGYGSSLKFKGDYVDKNYIVDGFGNRQFTSQIVAFDSLYYNHHDKVNQWRSEHIDREIVKAYAAFSVTPNRLNVNIHTKISTGNWGCGAFNCDKELKFLIQYLAASISQCSLHYYTFGDYELENKIDKFVHTITTHKFSVLRIYQVLIGMWSLDVLPNLETENYYPSTLKFVVETLLKEQLEESLQQMDESDSQLFAPSIDL